MVGRLLIASLLALIFGAFTLDMGAQGPAKGRKPKYPNVESQLSDLVEKAQLQGAQGRRALAAKAPVSRGSAVAVTIRVTEEADELADYLKSRGIDVRNVGDKVVEAYVELTDVPWLSVQPGVTRISLIRRGRKRAVISQGAVVHNALAYQATGFTGRGVRVGVIDGAFAGFRRLQGVELPLNVTGRCYTEVGRFSSNLADCEGDDPHGTGVAETILDMAPNVTLYIANPVSLGDLRATADFLTSQGVDIINHSVEHFWEGPGDGTSPFSDAALATVDRAISGGSAWVNAAGNEETATWIGSFSDRDGNGWLEMGPVEQNGLLGVTAGNGIALLLRWKDEFPGARTDLDLYLFDPSGTVVASSVDDQAGQSSHVPLESLEYTAAASAEYRLGIKHESGARPDYVHVQAFSSQPLRSWTPGYSVGTPAESFNLGLLAAGAADWRTPGTIEVFSSRGPTIDGRFKPDVVGADHGDTVSYGPVGFAGTSQATPHVTGLLALLAELFPQFGPEQLTTALIALSETRANLRPNHVWGYGFALLPIQPPSSLPIAFPPRGEALDFRNQLEAKYRDALRRLLSHLFADPEGSVVWTQEYLRYRLNQCDHVGAMLRVLAQIRGKGVLSACGQPPLGVIAFPPRDETAAFRGFLEGVYRDVLGRGQTPTFVDQEGDVVWISEYFRYRVNGCSHVEATIRVMLQIDGAGVQPVCR